MRDEISAEKACVSSFCLPPSSFLSRRVSPGECGFASSDGDPGTNGATFQKLAAECGINTICAKLQVCRVPWRDVLLHVPVPSSHDWMLGTRRTTSLREVDQSFAATRGTTRPISTRSLIFCNKAQPHEQALDLTRWSSCRAVTLPAL